MKQVPFIRADVGLDFTDGVTCRIYSHPFPFTEEMSGQEY
jgi:hypothetical protein